MKEPRFIVWGITDEDPIKEVILRRWNHASTAIADFRGRFNTTAVEDSHTGRLLAVREGFERP